ncbi:hypothetical protein EVAR_77872_1 [Eumeta japonica]|uniref:Uncharacterized protein n=1 Tax=Eumeta variegata TaxID=151549 RepID=A0A4C1TC86_EUMVA|nr:hypothetical protein EVAR_77872_1 [Eumeta japonica]
MCVTGVSAERTRMTVPARFATRRHSTALRVGEASALPLALAGVMPLSRAASLFACDASTESAPPDSAPAATAAPARFSGPRPRTLHLDCREELSARRRPSAAARPAPPTPSRRLTLGRLVTH